MADQGDVMTALPSATGGGAIRALSEQFTPDPYTGTGRLTVPLVLPPGRGDLAPRLAFTYSSGFGGGPFGLGWTLDLPSVSRSTARGFPGYTPADTFVLSGVDELVPAGGGRYVPAADTLSARIVHHTTGQDHWEVRTPDGLTSTYGTVLKHPSGAVFAWHLTDTTDAFGNTLHYGWRQSGGVLYPDTLRWLDLPDGRFLAEVRFQYEDRPDPFTDASAGFPARTALRCTRIEVFSGPDHATPIRIYHLGYAAPDQVSLLAEVRCEGVAGARTQQMPPLKFGYSAFAPRRAGLTEISGDGLPAASMLRSGVRLVDLFATGLPDLVHVGPGVRYWRNRGGGRFEASRQLPWSPAEPAADNPLFLADADGDGRVELLAGPQPAGWFPLTPEVTLAPQGFRRWTRAPSFRWDDPQVRLTDLDRDGVVDALRAGSRLECFLGDPRQGWRQVRSVEFPGIRFDDPRIRLADMTGDGSDALVRVQGNRVDYWPLHGPARWGARITMRGAPELPTGYDPRRLLLGDVDGDGTADLVYVDNRTVTVWLNRGGESWSRPIRITGTPPVSDADLVTLADLLGTGTRGVLWSRDAGAPGRSPLLFLDLTGGVKPYLLTEVDNGLGTVTRTEYAPSAVLRADGDRRRTTRWRTQLPFAVQVVRRVTVEDRLTKVRRTSDFAYRHGCWDSRDRQFRGFARVDRVDQETDASGLALGPVTELRTWFHVGTALDVSGEFWWGDPAGLADDPGAPALRGRIRRTELYALDGTDRQDLPYEMTEQQHTARPVPGASGAFQPLLTAARSTVWDRGDDPMTRVTVHQDHDAYGRAGATVEVAVPRGANWRFDGPAGTSGYLATRASTQWAQRDDDTLYRVDTPAVVTRVRLDVDAWTAAHGTRPSAVHIAALAGQHALVEEVLEQTTTRYDGLPFTGEPIGTLGRFGAVTREERLVLNDRVLTAGLDTLPPYLDGDQAGWAGYPAAFAAGLHPTAGYVKRPGGWFACVRAHRYDVHDDPVSGRGLVLASRDPMGAESTVGYDQYRVRPTRHRDPAGLETTVDYDTRRWLPVTVTDPNGARHVMAYTPLGLPEAIWSRGRAGETAGDPAATPGVTVEWDLLAWVRAGTPAGVRVTQRVWSAGDPTAPAAEADAVVIRQEYWDGTGRVLQERSSADPYPDTGLPEAVGLPVGAVPRPSPGTPVRVSGFQVFDQAGRVVERCAPYFADGWAYARPAPAQRQQPVVLRYDPRGVLVGTTNPDGSQRTVFRGIAPAPAPNLDRFADPDDFPPSPWEAHTYDETDNGGRTHPGDVTQKHCWNTPSSVVLDALGRPVQRVDRLRPAGSTAPPSDLVTTYFYDGRGNLSGVNDPAGRAAGRTVYSLTDWPMRVRTLDGGTRQSVHDAAGGLVERRDSKNAVLLELRDPAARPTRRWASDAGEAITLRERLSYGDTTSPAHRAAYRLGRLWEHDDESGSTVFERYDHTGRAVSRVHRTIRVQLLLDAVAAAVAGQQPVTPYRVDWTAGAGNLLDPAPHPVEQVVDALGRVRAHTGPPRADGTGRPGLTMRYEPGGGLKSVDVDGQAHLSDAAYTARGDPALMVIPDATGNFAVLRRWAYSATTGRLRRLRSERCAPADPADPARRYVVTDPAHPAQDVGYGYDLAGNLTGLDDRSPAAGPAGVGTLLRAYAYDSLARLTRVTGRECLPQAGADPWSAAPACGDPALTRASTETYEYDNAGNLYRQRREIGPGTVQVTEATAEPATNHLTSVLFGATTVGYGWDAAGNLTTETSSRHFAYDHANRMRAFTVQTGVAEPSRHVEYLYAADGECRLRVTRLQGGTVETRLVIDGAFEREQRATTVDTVHVWAGGRRLGTAQTRFLDDHLGSTVAVLDTGGTVLVREEYTAYGLTSFGGSTAKLIRFLGREREDGSGLADHSARWYAPWLARFTSCDRIGGDHLNPYVYARNNPASRSDPAGAASKPAGAKSEGWGSKVFRWWAGMPEPSPEPASDPVPAALSRPPPPPPAVDADIFADRFASEPIKPGELLPPYATIYRRDLTGPDTYLVEVSRDSGLSWEYTGVGEITMSAETPAPVAAEPDPDEFLPTAEGGIDTAELGRRIANGVGYGLLLGTMLVGLIALAVLPALGSDTRIGIPGLLMGIVVMGVISAVLVDPTPPRREPRAFRYGGWTIRT